MKIAMKGGAWKNSEDEILKAAVMKYGKTEWARVSSLLPRKTPKQCKARWEEWLDPRIRKTEWTREEDEKLMHLAKVLSGQWRTIASAMDRTAFQCSERYDKILDMASREDGEDDEDDDPRQLRSGEVDPHPESRPARPDPVDMDEDEKEMLQEARARLANTQGKKARRKQREREMELSRRLSSTQKRRELKAAGIEYNRKRLQRKGEIDWNAEVPFRKQIPAGYYDVSGEMTSSNRSITGQQLFNIEDNERQLAEERKRKADQKRFNQLIRTNTPEAMMQLNRLDKNNAVTTRRAKLNLPAPTLSDKELKTLLSDNPELAEAQDGSITSNLVSQPSATPGMNMRTPLARDVVMEEAKNQLLLQATPTPLEKSDRSIFDRKLYAGTGFNGLTPATGAPQTPSTPMTPGTPGLFTASQTKRRVDISSLREQLSSLPTPQNEYEATLPEEEEEKRQVEDVEMDAEEIERQIREEEEAMEREELERRSEVLKRELPRGNPIPNRFLMDISEAERLVKEEINSIIRYEDFKYPSAESTAKYTEEVRLPVLDYNDKITAEMMIFEEAGDLESGSGVSREELSQAYWKKWEEVNGRLMYNSETKSVEMADKMESEERLASLRNQYKVMEKLVLKQTKLVQKKEKNVKIRLDGYSNRQKNLVGKIHELHRNLDMTRMNYLCFSKLASQEQKMLALRMKVVKDNLKKEKARHAALQKKYKTLLTQLAE